MKARSPLGEARRERIVALARDLIRCKSLSGEERDVADVVARAMTALGYDEVKADALGNVVGRLRPAAPSSEGALLFDSHMDTVAAAGYWTKDPFGGEVSDGRIWGRGASDMKGALAASLCAAAFAQQDGRLRRDVLVCASVNEEQIEGLALAEVLDVYRPAYVVICESTALRLNIGGRGIHHHRGRARPRQRSIARRERAQAHGSADRGPTGMATTLRRRPRPRHP